MKAPESLGFRALLFGRRVSLLIFSPTTNAVFFDDYPLINRCSKLSKHISYLFDTFFRAFETAEMRNLPDYEEKPANFLPEIRQFSLRNQATLFSSHERM